MSYVYQEWLENPRAERVVLYEIGGKNTKRLNVANTPFIVDVDGKPIPFSALIAEPLVAVDGINDGVSVGELKLLNNGDLDWMLDDIWRGELISARWGDRNWDYGDFKIVFSGVVDDLKPERGLITLSFFDQSFTLQQMFATAQYNENIIPKSLGYVFNAGVLLKSALNLEYLINTEYTQSIVLRDSGVQIDHTLMHDDNGHAIAIPAIPPTRELRIDIIEQHDTIIKIAEFIAEQLSLELTTFYLKDWHFTAKVGVWVDNDRSINDVLTDLLKPLGIYHRIDLSNKKLELVYIDLSSNAIDYVITPFNIYKDSVKYDEYIYPAKKIIVAYRLNALPESDSSLASRFDPLSGNADDIAFAELLKNPYSKLEHNNELDDRYFDEKLYVTPLYSQADAQAELDRRVSENTVRQLISFDVFAVGIVIRVGDVISLTHGMMINKKGVVVYKKMWLGNVNRASLQVLL